MSCILHIWLLRVLLGVYYIYDYTSTTTYNMCYMHAVPSIFTTCTVCTACTISTTYFKLCILHTWLLLVLLPITCAICALSKNVIILVEKYKMPKKLENATHRQKKKLQGNAIWNIELWKVLSSIQSMSWIEEEAVSAIVNQCTWNMWNSHKWNRQSNPCRGLKRRL